MLGTHQFGLDSGSANVQCYSVCLIDHIMFKPVSFWIVLCLNHMNLQHLIARHNFFQQVTGSMASPAELTHNLASSYWSFRLPTDFLPDSASGIHFSLDQVAEYSVVWGGDRIKWRWTEPTQCSASSAYRCRLESAQNRRLRWSPSANSFSGFG
jgi:hypothetical protein